MSLEKIVRPFQLGDVFTARTMPPSQPSGFVESTDEPGLSWAGGTDGDYIADPDLGVYEIKSDAPLWEEDKRKRETETVRIENPDDPDQYVEIERIKRAVFQKQGTGEKLQIGIDWDKGRK